MKSYETIWEIFNKCPNNQMRDVFIDEVEVADTDAYIRQKFQDKNARGRYKKMRAYDVEKNIRHVFQNTRHIF